MRLIHFKVKRLLILKDLSSTKSVRSIVSDRFADNFTKTFSEVRQIGEERRIDRPKDFQEFWQRMAPAIAEWRAEQHGVHKQCMARGIDGLLENKTVKLYTIFQYRTKNDL